MTVASTDIKFRKSVEQTDIASNGGRKGITEIVSGVRHALFPRVTASQLAAGLIRHRKMFYSNENASDESAYGVMFYLFRPSTAGDRFYIAKGTQTDVQSAFARKSDISTYAATRYARTWCGVGQLQTALSGSETSVALTMEAADFEFPNGGYLYLSNNTMASQTIATGVNIGDSVTYSAGSWSKITHTTDITYPNGWYMGSNEVLTIQSTTNVEFLEIATNQYTAEDIGDGDGSDTAPELTTLAHVTNGICRQSGLLPVVTATCGATSRTVNVAADGSCSGYCSAGALNMATGVWTTDITWTTAPDNSTDITITYAENCYSYSGNVATVELVDQVANAYTTATTFGCGCIYDAEVKCVNGAWTITSSAGTYDKTTYPLIMYNDGTVEETWTRTFTSASAFTVSGAYYGSVGTGTIGEDFSPINPDTGQPYFTISAAGHGGTWSSGDSDVFTTSPSAMGIIVCQEVPTGTTAESNNALPYGSMTE